MKKIILVAAGPHRRRRRRRPGSRAHAARQSAPADHGAVAFQWRSGARPRPDRAKGITYDLAVEAAQTAVAACAAMPKNYRVTALVTDSAAVPIALVTGDNGAAITQRIAMGKAQLVVKYKTSSSDAVAKAKTDPAFVAELAANPLIVAARPGGLPILIGSDLVGTISVSGTPDGHDDDCAKAGLDKIAGKLKTF